MKKILSILAIACGICLLASCQASEAVTRNLIKYNGYEYAIASASQYVDRMQPDTVKSTDGDTLGFQYCLVLNSPYINIDTLDLKVDHNDTLYTYPTDRKFAQLVIEIVSPGLNGICPGEYSCDKPGNSFFYIEDTEVNSDDDLTANGTKVITVDEYNDIIAHIDNDNIQEQALTVKKGTLFYEIEFRGKSNYGMMYAYYCGPIPLLSYYPFSRADNGYVHYNEYDDYEEYEIFVKIDNN